MALTHPDVLMPFRTTPFNKDEHLKALRYSILGVAVFIFIFSLVFDQNQEIALYFAVTFAIFAGGVGAVIIGGLYWDRGTTEGAWAAMIVGASVAVTGTIVPQVSDSWLIDSENMSWLRNFILKYQNSQKWLENMLYPARERSHTTFKIFEIPIFGH